MHPGPTRTSKKETVMKKGGGEEYREQVAVFKWAKYNLACYPELRMLHASQNGLRVGIGQARKAVASGLVRGVPDISLPVPRGGYCGLFIELKTETGRLSPEQRAWLEDLTRFGYKAVMCRGWMAAVTTIEEYLNLPNTNLRI